MLYTRKGDDGTSGLFGTKERFPKTHSVYEALGSLDELNSLLGVCRAKALKETALSEVLLAVQQQLFIVQAELAGAPKRLAQKDVDGLEQLIAQIEAALPRAPQSFVIAGTSESEALLDYARAMSRRVERRILAAERPLCEATRRYLNRLSSLLYALGRQEAARVGIEEPSPTY